MKKVVIFGGTTEGRMLSGRLSETGRAHLVCVAGKYGEELLAETDYARICTGRMDEEEMVRFFAAERMGEDDLILDATHPYAAQVTENIRKAAEKTGATCVRIIRERGVYPSGDVSCYADAAACARELRKESGNILLTTGSRELAAYCAEVPEEVRFPRRSGKRPMCGFFLPKRASRSAGRKGLRPIISSRCRGHLRRS